MTCRLPAQRGVHPFDLMMDLALAATPHAAGAAHPLEAFGPGELDHMAARLGPVFGADLDIFRHAA